MSGKNHLIPTALYHISTKLTILYVFERIKKNLKKNVWLIKSKSKKDLPTLCNMYMMFPHDILGLISLALSLVDMLLLRILENNKTSCFTHAGLSEPKAPFPRF